MFGAITAKTAPMCVATTEPEGGKDSIPAPSGPLKSAFNAQPIPITACWVAPHLARIIARGCS